MAVLSRSEQRKGIAIQSAVPFRFLGSGVLDYFRDRAEIEAAGDMPHLLRNHLDRHDAVNATARVLTVRGLSFVGRGSCIIHREARLLVEEGSHFDPADLEQVCLLRRLSPGQRIRRLFDTRALAVGLVRGRLQRIYPDLSPAALNVKVLEEIHHGERTRT